jgi:hypothetical protein
MQNKMKLFLMMVIVFGGGFLMSEKASANACDDNGGICVNCTGVCMESTCTDAGHISALTSYDSVCASGASRSGAVCCNKRTTRAFCECGSSGPFASKPTANLCNKGTATDPTGTGPWNWKCGVICGSVNCSATKSGTTGGCCCEDTNEKRCAEISCSESCAGATKHTTACSAIPNYATKCSGTTGSDRCTSGTCQSNCSSPGAGACSAAGKTCCLDDPATKLGLPVNQGLVKGILTNVVDWLLSIVGIIAIIGFIISGFQYFLVATDEKMVEKAKKTMVASIIGLVVALSGFIAIKTVDFLLR